MAANEGRKAECSRAITWSTQHPMQLVETEPKGRKMFEPCLPHGTERFEVTRRNSDYIAVNPMNRKSKVYVVKDKKLFFFKDNLKKKRL